MRFWDERTFKLAPELVVTMGAVPEPVTLALPAAGLASLGGYLRRQRRTA